MVHRPVRHDIRAPNHSNRSHLCNTSQIITLNIDDHRQLCVFFQIFVELNGQPTILECPCATRSRTFDWTRVKTLE